MNKKNEASVSWSVHLQKMRRILKRFWFPIVCVSALFIGLSVGYVMLGKQSAGELFHIGTWKHLLELVFAES